MYILKKYRESSVWLRSRLWGLVKRAWNRKLPPGKIFREGSLRSSITDYNSIFSPLDCSCMYMCTCGAGILSRWTRCLTRRWAISETVLLSCQGRSWGKPRLVGMLVSSSHMPRCVCVFPSGACILEATVDCWLLAGLMCLLVRSSRYLGVLLHFPWFCTFSFLFVLLLFLLHSTPIPIDARNAQPNVGSGFGKEWIQGARGRGGEKGGGGGYQKFQYIRSVQCLWLTLLLLLSLTVLSLSYSWCLLTIRVHAGACQAEAWAQQEESWEGKVFFG